MNKLNPFHQMLSNYFLKHIPNRSDYSTNTIKSYRDAFILLFQYHQTCKHQPISDMTFAIIDNEYLQGFLSWLEQEKTYSVTSINLRLAAIHAFYRYVQSYAPEYAACCEVIFSIKSRKVPIFPVKYLTIKTVQCLLELPDANTADGIRDLAVLTLLYDSGARVQEIVDLSFGDLRFEKPGTLRITGKGNKTRIIPIMPQTLDILNAYVKSCRCASKDTSLTAPLFFNKSHRKLTRAGIAYILQKYVEKGWRTKPELFPDKVSPHTLRHSKAMHLLEAGVNLVYIRDFLGHSSVLTTEVYAKANPEVKRKAIEAAGKAVLPHDHYSVEEKQEMMDWLKNLV